MVGLGDGTCVGDGAAVGGTAARATSSGVGAGGRVGGAWATATAVSVGRGGGFCPAEASGPRGLGRGALALDEMQLARLSLIVPHSDVFFARPCATPCLSDSVNASMAAMQFPDFE